jgi:pilus assembly protein CpaD
MIKLRPCHAALPLMLALAACEPGVAEYTTAEAPNHLALNGAESRIVVRFVPGSARLARGEAQRLQKLALTGAILPEDRVLVAAAGSPSLAAARDATISRTLLPERIIVRPTGFPWVARNRAVLTVARILVTLPACPNWSGPTPTHFTNQRASNFGCATTTDLGLMAASPADLARAAPLGPANAEPAVLATNLYLVNKVPPPGAAAAGGAAVTPAAGAGASAGGQ